MICLSFRTFTVNIVNLLAFNNLKNYFIYCNVMFFVSPDYKTSIFQFPEQYSFLYSFLSFPFFFIFYFLLFISQFLLLFSLIFSFVWSKPSQPTAQPHLHKPTTNHRPSSTNPQPHTHHTSTNPSSGHPLSTALVPAIFISFDFCSDPTQNLKVFL